MQSSGNPAIKFVLSALLLLISFNSFSVTEVVTYYHNDALGSPVAATDEQGNVIWRETYEPYGKRISVEEASKENEQFYTGKQEEAELGLQYFGARWYDPGIGRFISMDPVGFQEGNIHSFNRYAYANSNPYRYVDPDGNYAKNVADFALNVTINYVTTGQPGFGAAALDSAVNTLNPFSTATKAAKLGKILYAKNKLKNTGDIPKYARNKYKSLTPNAKKEVLQKEPTCVYCKKKPSDTVDHVRSQKQDFVEGGFKDTRDVRSARVNDPSNLAGACRSCNSSKGSKDLKDWSPPEG